MVRLPVMLAAIVGLAACTSQPMPKPDAGGTYYFWTQEEQVLGYRNMEKVFPAHVIRRGDHVAPLPEGARLVLPNWTDPVAKAETNLKGFMERAGVAGILVLHKDRIVLEQYARGYGRGQRWTSFSVGKSFSSTLMGAAIKDGAIGGVDDPVTKYLPQLKGSGYDGVTIRQVLNMTSGVKWNEDYDDPKSDVAMIRGEKSVNGSDPVVAYMSRLKREAEPGMKFVYKTGETHLIGSIIRAATNKSMADYLSEKIWKPYGMEMDGVWTLDDAGHEFSGCCISATLRDFGRYGVFFKNGAKIDGKPIVPDTWVKDATTGSSASKGYGYQWWLTNGPAYNAQGIFGQQMHINPDKDLIIVVQSATVGATNRQASQSRSAFIAAVTKAIP